MILGTERLFLRELTPADCGARLRANNANNLRRTRRSRNKSFGRAFSPRRARLRIAKAFRLRITLQERQYKSFDQTFSKVCGVQRQRLWSLSAESETPQRQELRRDQQRRGYAKEAAGAVLQWALQNTDYPAFYSYCKSTNTASVRTAEAIGMRFDREYPDAVNGITHVSVIRRDA